MAKTNTKYGRLITQELLNGFAEARFQKLQIERRLRQFRAALLLLHEMAIPSEPGTLSLHVEERQSVSFSEQKLEKLLGVRQVAQLRNQLTPSITRTIRVVPSPRDLGGESKRPKPGNGRAR